jgi:Ca2+-binding EF-hand superfamily protein
MSLQSLLRSSFALITAVLVSFAVCNADIDPDTLATLKTRFAAADKNGDGKLTRDECQAGMPRIYRGFDKIDADGKGYITLDQIITFVANR